jgi:hypothetical protein
LDCCDTITDALLPDGSVWPWAIAGTAAAMRAIAAIDKLEIVLCVVIVLVSFFLTGCEVT